MVNNYPGYTEDDEVFISFSHNHPSGLELKFGLSDKIFYDRILSVADVIAQIEIHQNNGDGYYLSITYNVPYLDLKHNDKYWQWIVLSSNILWLIQMVTLVK